MNPLFHGQAILVTGACGTVGSELIRQLLTDPAYAPGEVIGIDNSESEIFFLDQHYLNDGRARFFVADVRDGEELVRKTAGVDIVFHCAALKHVILCERSPEQAVQVNILGVQNIISAAQANGVKRVIFTSSDKAVNPTNVMGTSKLMGERLITAANSRKRGAGPIFASTRFGNVLGSNGSVVPIFHNQIASGSPVTLTHRDMTRFVMSIEDAVRLVIDSATLARGGEVFVTKMPVVCIKDLAAAMIAELAGAYGRKPQDVEIVEIGVKAGEKLYEELMSQEEMRRALDLRRYFSILPAFRGIYHEIRYEYDDLVSGQVLAPYVSASETPLSVLQIRQLLRDGGLVNRPEREGSMRYWPGDKEEKRTCAF
ncbi:polysaccharide biosynthesis protein [Burkholderia sp. BDU5]|uniref:polysaccharide biosynthesis protein n=1 Tax=Burkholderia sp. BDU5 TaxID=1385590 RepID=UPI000759CF66|nr:polysaccharide biosynthesis protein [Burkholderia sp. BDU5]KVE36839.1 capsule biosynthesis protein CapD [Burkholderia sp. BDU5]